ncbi:unnamed protein product [Merluccius merluccius]
MHMLLVVKASGRGPLLVRRRSSPLHSGDLEAPAQTLSLSGRSGPKCPDLGHDSQYRPSISVSLILKHASTASQSIGKYFRGSAS